MADSSETLASVRQELASVQRELAHVDDLASRLRIFALHRQQTYQARLAIYSALDNWAAADSNATATGSASANADFTTTANAAATANANTDATATTAATLAADSATGASDLRSLLSGAWRASDSFWDMQQQRVELRRRGGVWRMPL